MVAAEHRGRGIGRQLLEAAVEWSRMSEIGKLELHVFPCRTSPRCGCTSRSASSARGTGRGHYARDDELVDAILMAYAIE